MPTLKGLAATLDDDPIRKERFAPEVLKALDWSKVVVTNFFHQPIGFAVLKLNEKGELEAEARLDVPLFGSEPIYCVPEGNIIQTHMEGDVEVIDQMNVTNFTLTTAPTDPHLTPLTPLTPVEPKPEPDPDAKTTIDFWPDGAKTQQEE